MSKYIEVDTFLQGITSIVRRVNSAFSDKRSKKPSDQTALKSANDKDEQTVYEKQMRMNALSPTKSGVISSPDPREQAVIQGQSGSPVYKQREPEK